MNGRATPQCPRCNSSNAVKQLAEDASAAQARCIPIREGYSLAGLWIRPENPDWYCSACAERFGASRPHWGEPLTGSIQ